MFIANLEGEISLSGDNVINTSVLASILQEAKGQDIHFKIKSIGGLVDEAFKMNEQIENYKQNNQAKIITEAIETCASSAVVLLLSGDERIVDDNTKPFIHEANISVENATANQLFNVAFDVEKVNFDIAKFYEEKTKLTYDEARNLMGLDTSLTAEECFELGFSTIKKSELINKELILNKLIEIKNENQMNKQNFIQKFEVLLNELLGSTKTPEIQNKIVYDSVNSPVEIVDAEESDSYEVGDKVIYQDKSDYTGEILLSNTETLVVENGVITVVKTKEAEVVEEEIENLKTEVEEAKNQTAEIQNKLDEANKTIESLKAEKSNLETTINEIKNLKPEAPKEEAKEKIENKQEPAKYSIAGFKERQKTN